jgi:hypothetical protein
VKKEINYLLYELNKLCQLFFQITALLQTLIGAANFSLAQGSFRSVQLFGARTHQVPWCAADTLQPVSCKNVLRQSSPGPCHDSAARNRPWSFCSVAGNSLVCPSIAPVLSLCSDRHWVQVLRLCTCVNDGNIRRS